MLKEKIKNEKLISIFKYCLGLIKRGYMMILPTIMVIFGYLDYSVINGNKKDFTFYVYWILILFYMIATTIYILLPTKRKWILVMLWSSMIIYTLWIIISPTMHNTFKEAGCLNLYGISCDKLK